MKCHSLVLFLSLFGFLSRVASLVVTIEKAHPIAGELTTVAWTTQASDPENVTFDLRFVQQGNKDVGLAKANIHTSSDEDSGTVSVAFPQPGTYKLVAVTGSPRFEPIGDSNEVACSEAPSSSTSSPSSTSPPTSTATQLSDPVNSPIARTPISGASKNANLPAIVGGVIGALLLLTLLVAVSIFVYRRRQVVQRRISFHKDMMIQPRSPAMSQAALRSGIIIPYPFATSPNLQRPPPAYRPESVATDIESAYSEPPSPTSAYPSGMSGILLPPSGVSAHLGTGHIVPPPRGPRERTKRDTNFRAVHFGVTPLPPLPALPAAPPLLTTRQKEIADRMVQLQNQINELQSQNQAQRSSAVSVASSERLDKSSNRRVVLEDMRKQMMWLSEVKDSKWAKNETDIKPAGYSRYMTP